jgi:hypothetical protein
MTATNSSATNGVAANGAAKNGSATNGAATNGLAKPTAAPGTGPWDLMSFVDNGLSVSNDSIADRISERMREPPC